MNTEKTDIVLIQEIKAGDQQAFRLLYGKYNKLFFLTCIRYLKNKETAQDLLQDAFVKIYKDLDSYDPKKGSFKNWAQRVVINSCLMQLRKKNILRDFENIMDISNVQSVSSSAISNLSLQELLGLIKLLPKGYRTIFNLYVIDGYSHKEIATMLDISESTSKTQLMKSKKLLQKKLEKAEFQHRENYA